MSTTAPTGSANSPSTDPAATPPAGWVDVRVVGPAGSADLAVPTDRPVAEIVADLAAHLLPGAPLPPPTRGWHLHRLGRPAFPPGGDLRGHDLVHGDVLHLSPVEVPAATHTVDDTLVVLADGIAAHGRWDRARGRRALAVAAFTLLSAAGVLAWAAGRGPAVPLLVAAGCMLAAGVLRRTPGPVSDTTSAAAGLAALPPWVLTGLALADVVGANPAEHLTLAGLGLAAGSAAVAACAPQRPRWWTFAGVVGASVALGGCLASSALLDTTAAGAVLAVVLLAVSAALPWAVTRTPPWVSSASDRSEPDLQRYGARTRDLVAAAVDATVVVVGACGVLLALRGSALALGLAAALGALTLVRARHTVFALDSSVAAVSGVVVLGAVVAELLSGAGLGPRLVALVVLGSLGAACLAVHAELTSERSSSLLERLRGPRLRRSLGTVETLLAITVLPLLAGVLGIYDLAADAGSRL